MEAITLAPMTRALCRQYFQGFENDPDLFMDMSGFRPYRYSDERADRYYDRQVQKKRLHFVVLRAGIPVGEVLLKDMDAEKCECTLSIHLQNDLVKGIGIGTQAERLILTYAFTELGMERILADAVLKNTRSQHVLEKLGFQLLRQDEMFRFYALERAAFEAADAPAP